MNFAIIENNEIINIFVCDSLENAKLLHGDNVVDVTNENISVGDIWNETHQKFIRPMVEDFYELDENGNWYIPGKPSNNHIYNTITRSWELIED